MEWLYGLLIGSTFTAVLMHLAQRGHRAEIREKPDAAGGVLKPSAAPNFNFPLPVRHVNTRDAVDRLDNTPPDCSCDWDGIQALCESEPKVWYRCRRDPECPAHKADDWWLTKH